MKQHEFIAWLEGGCPVEGQPPEPAEGVELRLGGVSLGKGIFIDDPLDPSLPGHRKAADSYFERLKGEWASEFVTFPEPRTIEFTTTPDKAPKPGEVIKHKGDAFLVDDVHFEGGDGPTRCRVRAREAEAALRADTVDASTIALEALKGAHHGMTGHEPPKAGGVFPGFKDGHVGKARLTEREAMRMKKVQLKVWIWENDVSEHERHELDDLTKAELVEIATGAELGECFIGVDHGSSGDSTCFVRMERSTIDGSWVVQKCLTLPSGGHEVTHAHRIDSGDMAAAKGGATEAMADEIARGLEVPREVVLKMMKTPGELMFRVG